MSTPRKPGMELRHPVRLAIALALAIMLSLMVWMGSAALVERFL